MNTPPPPRHFFSTLGKHKQSSPPQWPCLAGVDLLSLDGRSAIGCCAEALEFPQVRRFLRLAKWVYKAHRGRLWLPCHAVLLWHMFDRCRLSWLEFR